MAAAPTERRRRLTERQQLQMVVREFGAVMLAKLQTKRLRGFTGWNATNLPDSVLERGLMDHVARAMRDPKQWIDVANFAAFLWWRACGSRRRR